MPKPRLVPFEAIHLRMVVNRDMIEQDPWLLAVEKQHGGPAVTAFVGNTPIGCAGVVLPWSGVGLVWMTLSESVGRHGVWMTKTTRRFLADVIRIYALHRIEAVVMAGNIRNQQWIEHLGFRPEEQGRARKYTSDKRDMIRYERII